MSESEQGSLAGGGAEAVRRQLHDQAWFRKILRADLWCEGKTDKLLPDAQVSAEALEVGPFLLSMIQGQIDNSRKYLDAVQQQLDDLLRFLGNANAEAGGPQETAAQQQAG
jgi:hypothetical protein